MYDKPGVSQQPEFTTVLEAMYPLPFAHLLHCILKHSLLLFKVLPATLLASCAVGFGQQASTFAAEFEHARCVYVERYG